MPRALLVLSLLLLLEGHAAGEAVVVETAHYRLHYEGRRAEAEAYARVLEAAWPGFAAFFGEEPRLAEGEKLVVRFYATHDAWAAGIQADGTQAPSSAGGYYWPPSRTAYLYRQPTEYFTRVLLVHEATHQFHYLARTDNKNPTVGWYLEGVAEHVSWHAWDGARLTLGALPLVSLKDYPAAALAEVSAPGFDLEAVVEGRVPASRAISWALYRYLATGKGGQPLPGFDLFRRKMDQGGAVGPAFRRAFGPPARLLPRLLAWLADEQQPFAQVFNEWEGTGPGHLRGHAGVVSLCRLKAEVRVFEAALDVPAAGAFRGGLALSWAGNGDYTVALVREDGTLRVDRRKDGAWQILLEAPGPAPPRGKPLPLVARRDGNAVYVTVGGHEHGPFVLPGRSFGLAVDASDLAFRDVRWR